MISDSSVIFCLRLHYDFLSIPLRSVLRDRQFLTLEGLLLQILEYGIAYKLQPQELADQSK